MLAFKCNKQVQEKEACVIQNVSIIADCGRASDLDARVASIMFFSALLEIYCSLFLKFPSSVSTFSISQLHLRKDSTGPND